MSAPGSVPVKPPHPYGTYITLRSSFEDHRFKTHNTLGQVKNAVVNRQSCYSGDQFLCDITVYRLEGDVYLPWLHLAKGTSRDDYPELSAVRLPSKRQKEYEVRRVEAAAAYYQEEAIKKAAEAQAMRTALEEGRL